MKKNREKMSDRHVTKKNNFKYTEEQWHTLAAIKEVNI